MDRHPEAGDGRGGGDELKLVTAADTSHARSLLQLLRSVRRYEPGLPVIVYDLGLTRFERWRLRRFRHEVRKFAFERYPPHLNLRVKKGEYAWKPVIVNEVAAAHTGLVCWMDAGCILLEDLAALRDYVRRHGFYSPASGGTIAEWTHPGMLAYFGLRADWEARARPNLNAACIAFDTRHTDAMAVIVEWGRCALIKDCIAPPGSDRKNHRQDQALLSVLAYRSALVDRPAPSKLGFRTQADRSDMVPATSKSLDEALEGMVGRG